jgi:hypothetical protein
MFAKKRTTEEEKEEFNKLYNLLASLSNKPSTHLEPTQQAQAQVKQLPICNPLLLVDSDSDEEDEFTKMKRDILINFSKKESVTPISVSSPIESKAPIAITIVPESPPIENVQSVNNTIITELFKIENKICKGCDKPFGSDEILRMHLERSDACRSWSAISPNKHEQVQLSGPIHLLIDDWLSTVITGDKPLQCKFCKSTFVSKGNHHKHYYTATACNRMAYYEFKKLISSI